MPELRVTVRMVCSLFCLSVALQAVVQIVEYLCHLRMTDRMFLLGELCGNCPRAFTNPSQGRFRIAACLAINHRFQCLQQTRMRVCGGLASSTRVTYVASRRHYPFLTLNNSSSNGFARQAACAMYLGDSTKAQTYGFICCHDTARALIQ